VNEQEVAELVARAEREGFTVWLYRLDCEHAKRWERARFDDDLVMCFEGVCDGEERAIMYRITPQSEPQHWPDWRTG
jgi:hypothetical protein